jgi:hypothetical protein
MRGVSVKKHRDIVIYHRKSHKSDAKGKMTGKVRKNRKHKCDIVEKSVFFAKFFLEKVT